MRMNYLNYKYAPFKCSFCGMEQYYVNDGFGAYRFFPLRHKQAHKLKTKCIKCYKNRRKIKRAKQ